MARKHYRSKRGGSKSFSFGGALKILGGTAVAVAYEVFVSPLIPFAGTIKNIIELALGLFIASMRGMPDIIRAGGIAIATINAYQLIYPLMSGMGGSSSTYTVPTGYNV